MKYLTGMNWKIVCSTNPTPNPNPSPKRPSFGCAGPNLTLTRNRHPKPGARPRVAVRVADVPPGGRPAGSDGGHCARVAPQGLGPKPGGSSR
eukprot:495420-Prorocentrum_minimum.AAC.2